MVAVNLKTEAYDIRIDRRTRWGNPFLIGRHGTREEVIARHRAWLWSEIRSGRILISDLAALHNKRLGCHCAPLGCHGDTLTAAAAWAYEQTRDLNGGASVSEVCMRERRPAP